MFPLNIHLMNAKEYLVKAACLPLEVPKDEFLAFLTSVTIFPLT